MTDVFELIKQRQDGRYIAPPAEKQSYKGVLSLIGTGLGAGAGAFAGNPMIGAQLGGAAGGLAGDMVDNNSDAAQQDAGGFAQQLAKMRSKRQEEVAEGEDGAY